MTKKPDEAAIAQPLARRPLTPEQQERVETVRRRAAIIQHGIKPPESGTFGKGVPDKKKEKKGD